MSPAAGPWVKLEGEETYPPTYHWVLVCSILDPEGLFADTALWSGKAWCHGPFYPVTHWAPINLPTETHIPWTNHNHVPR